MTDESGRLRAPFAAMLWNPLVGHALQQLGSELRDSLELDRRLVELAVVRVARVCGSHVELVAHRRIGERIGLDAGALDAAEQGFVGHSLPQDFQEAAGAVLLAVDVVLGQQDLDDAVLHRLDHVLGPVGLFEVTTLVGYYWLLARQMRLFGEDGEGDEIACHS